MKQFLTLLALAAASPLLAQPGEEPIPSPAALERMCSAQGAMQYAFGQTGVPLSTRLEADLGPGFKLPPPLAPFTKGQPRSTAWSGRLMEMAYSVRIEQADQERIITLIGRIGDSLEEAGWKRIDLPAEEAPIYLLAYGSNDVFERPAEGSNGPTRVLLSLDHALGELVLTCGRDDLLRSHASEAFGELPPGTPRPTVPDIKVPAIRSEADCARPEILAEVAALFTGTTNRTFMGSMMARTLYRDRLTTWMLWKLETSGTIAKDKLLNLSLAAAGGASPGGNPFAALQSMQEMFPLIEAIGKAEKSGDPAAMCRSLIPFEQWMTRVDAITLKQTEATQAALSAEAKRLGISLD